MSEGGRTELIGVRNCWTALRVRREGEGGGRREAEGGVRREGEGGVRQREECGVLDWAVREV